MNVNQFMNFMEKHFGLVIAIYALSGVVLFSCIAYVVVRVLTKAGLF